MQTRQPTGSWLPPIAPASRVFSGMIERCASCSKSSPFVAAREAPQNRPHHMLRRVCARDRTNRPPRLMQTTHATPAPIRHPVNAQRAQRRRDLMLSDIAHSQSHTRHLSALGTGHRRRTRGRTRAVPTIYVWFPYIFNTYYMTRLCLPTHKNTSSNQNTTQLQGHTQHPGHTQPVKGGFP